MQRDIRSTPLYRDAEALYRTLLQPGTGQICDAEDIHASPDGKHAIFSGTIMEKLEGAPPTRICRVDLACGDVRVLTFGPFTDRQPKFSPDGRQIAFLSDRGKASDFQLYLLDPTSGAARATQSVEGWVEYLRWSPDSSRILLGVAGRGADMGSAQGGAASLQDLSVLPSWVPSVDTGDESYRWRRAWIYELATDRMRVASAAETNVWDAAWCGNDAIAAVISQGPAEGLWYGARLHLIDIESGRSREMFRPTDQLGSPAASPSGRRLAIVEALCSDRGVAAGDLRVIDTLSGQVERVNTQNVDISYTEWRSEQKLLLAGHRGFDTVVGLYDTVSCTFTEMWSCQHLSTGGMFVTVSGCGEPGDCVLVGESFVQAPEIAVIRQGRYRRVRSLDLGYADEARAIEKAEQAIWKAADGLEIQGWLLRPAGASPHPLIMRIHGGPVWHTRPRWLVRWDLYVLMLLKRGYAVFFPNPRGSAGRGQAFIRHVIGDLGGADAQDLFSGLDALIERGVADPKRLGVIGTSYGGFMTSWLITQSTRFAAAVSIAAHNNHVTERLLSNIPQYMDIFLGGQYYDPNGKYFHRSPIMHAKKTKTPTLHVCGQLDRCTPPEEAAQFHNALLENGVESVLVQYPEEGHGVNKFPAEIDYAARVVAWFEEHVGAQGLAAAVSGLVKS